jgi:NADP-dependent 3-hydroxy acid dehydrogenase YdfG
MLQFKYTEMVTNTAIAQSNALFASQKPEGLVCVLAGATSGIGLATLEKLAAMLQSSKFYVLGRSEFATQLKELKNSSPSSEFIFIETQVSLISNIDQACQRDTTTEQKVDYLCMSQGSIPFQGYVCR